MAIVGFVDSEGDNIYNAAAVIGNNKIQGIYHKIFLPNHGVFDEKRYFSAGREAYVFEYKDTKFGVTICEDIWYKDGPIEKEAKNGAKIIFNINASPYHSGKINWIKFSRHILRKIGIQRRLRLVRCQLPLKLPRIKLTAH